MKQKARKPKQNTRGKRIKLVVLCALVAAFLAFGGMMLLQHQQGKTESEAAIEQMEKIVPGFGQENMYSSGAGRDPLPILEIQGVDIVGAIEIPSLNLRAPVTNKGVKKKYFARWAGGSPVKGRFRIMGDSGDVFSSLSKGKPGERVIFTDMDGVRYEYTITTQFHLKDWAKADNDLMLCYKVDSDTKFVLGCTKAD